MSKMKGLKGMHHLALQVKDVKASKAFYQEMFGMEIVWEPDEKNVYLSSGTDNLALHEVDLPEGLSRPNEHLDHLGFIIDRIETVKELEKEFRTKKVTIVHPFKNHRDGSASFYCADPDGIVIQLLYEPHLSR
ncbi:MAG: VOC family protein [Deltaproteobacteria bacterium]|nr:VOC family protein [Deltaproteobacteria bacterium]